jgi:plasmid stabilization system protein ParE
MKERMEREAVEEFIDAMNFHDRRRQGLGNALYDEVNEGIRKILENPKIGTLLIRNVRGYCINRFKYYIIYQELPDEIRIKAVMHTSRRPGYWMDRL